MADSKVQPELIEVSDDFPFTGNVSGSIPTDGSITDAKVVDIAASKLTGALPALNGVAVTGVITYTKSASDPTTEINPSAVGAIWANYTSGETYVCTDATVDANTWTNVGTGEGNIVPWQYGGSISGYTAGGYPPVDYNVIQKFSFAADGNSTDVGDLTQSRHANTGISGTDYGYCAGGTPDPVFNIVDKFAFASDGNAVDQGDLTVARANASSSSSATYGYVAGGLDSQPTPAAQNVIDKFSFAASGNSTDVGDLATAHGRPMGQTSSTHGYSSSGTVVNQFSHATDGNATGVGALSDGREWGAGQSSTTYGYSSGGTSESTVIDKFSFSSHGTATSVGTLYVGRSRSTGQSSENNGYTSGGVVGGATAQNTIDKFSFSSDGTATDSGDLLSAEQLLSGQHN